MTWLQKGAAQGRQGAGEKKTRDEAFHAVLMSLCLYLFLCVRVHVGRTEVDVRCLPPSLSTSFTYLECLAELGAHPFV